MWTDLRKEIEQVRQTLRLPERAFAPLSCTTNWRQLEDNICHTFCELPHQTFRPVWLWEWFRPGAYGLYSSKNELDTMLSLVEEEELVWLMVNDSANKFWFYQGKRVAIQAVLNECYHLDEIYLISKKYEWLLCLNHHDVIYGIGQEMSEKLKQQGGKPVIYSSRASPSALPGLDES